MPWAANMEIHNIYLNIIDNDHSTLSQRLVDKIAASTYFPSDGSTRFVCCRLAGGRSGNGRHHTGNTPWVREGLDKWQFATGVDSRQRRERNKGRTGPARI